MSGRLPSGVLVSALIRRVNDAGGNATVIVKGDAQAGAILIITADRSQDQRLLERGIGPDGKVTLIDSTPAEDLDGYCHRRSSRDPDLWLIELDVAGAQQFAAETILLD
jgi:hypothetical protein